MSNINYIVSSSLAYHLLICNDAGPEYAKMMGWQTIPLAELKELTTNNIYVIDNRITAPECLIVSKIISSNRQIHFVLKIVDPYIEHLDNYYYQWIMTMVEIPNVQLLTVYEPKEFTKIVSKFTKNPIIYIPYAYNSSKEVALDDISKRKNQIIISGAVNAQYYPKRAVIWQESRRSLSRFFYPTLRHPGYSEMTGNSPSHQFIGSSYINYLSKYKFMLLCGSRCRIELLKFHECAYSGCLPIGECPTILEEISDIFTFPETAHLTASTIKLLRNWNAEDHNKQVNRYRAYLQETRSQNKLNNLFQNQLIIS